MADGRWAEVDAVATPGTSDRDADGAPPGTHVDIELHVVIESAYRPPTHELRGRRIGSPLRAALVALVVAVVALTATLATYLKLGWPYTPVVLVVVGVMLRLVAVPAGAWIAGIDRRDEEP